MKKIELVLSFKPHTVDVYNLWLSVREQLIGIGLKDTPYTLFDKQMAFDRLSHRIRISPRDGFEVSTTGIEAAVFTRNDQIDLVLIDTDRELDWATWVEKLSKHGEFGNAYVGYEDYIFWQTTENIQAFEAGNRSYKNLPIIPTGWPSPMPQEKIDVSQNPSRRSYKEGWLEISALPMWISLPLLEQLGGESKLNKLPDEFVIQRTDAFVIIDHPDSLFGDDSSIDVQRTFRKIMFDP